MALTDNAQAAIGLALVALLAAVLAGGFYLLVRPDPPPPTISIVQEEETWCTGFAAGQVVIGREVGMGRPTADQFDQIIERCIELGAPSEPLSNWISEGGGL